MKNKLLFLFTIGILFSCSNSETEEAYIPIPYTLEIPELFQLKLINPLIPSSNPLTEEGVSLGKKLFFDRKLSGNNSQSCASCHSKAHTAWKTSQHALANQVFDETLHGEAFENTQSFVSGGTTTTVTKVEGESHVIVEGPDGRFDYQPAAVIGITPLVQYLIPFPGGRLQTLDWAYDPIKKQWFNVFAKSVTTVCRCKIEWPHTHSVSSTKQPFSIWVPYCKRKVPQKLFGAINTPGDIGR